MLGGNLGSLMYGDVSVMTAVKNCSILHRRDHVMFFSHNHDDDFVIESTDLPDHLVTKVGGIPLFEHDAPLVSMPATYMYF